MLASHRTKFASDAARSARIARFPYQGPAAVDGERGSAGQFSRTCRIIRIAEHADRLTLAEVVLFRKAESCSLVRCHRGDAQGCGNQCQSRQRPSPATVVRPCGPQLRQTPPDCLGGDRPCRVPAIRGYQRGVLLWRDTVAGRGLFRKRRAADQYPVGCALAVRRPKKLCKIRL